MAVTRFEDLEVWQEATSLAVEVYTVSKAGDLSHDFGFKDQLKRSAVSIASNIAEGKERETISEFVRFLYREGIFGRTQDSDDDRSTYWIHRAIFC